MLLREHRIVGATAILITVKKEMVDKLRVTETKVWKETESLE